MSMRLPRCASDATVTIRAGAEAFGAGILSIGVAGDRPLIGNEPVRSPLERRAGSRRQRTVRPIVDLVHDAFGPRLLQHQLEPSADGIELRRKRHVRRYPHPLPKPRSTAERDDPLRPARLGASGPHRGNRDVEQSGTAGVERAKRETRGGHGVKASRLERDVLRIVAPVAATQKAPVR